MRPPSLPRPPTTGWRSLRTPSRPEGSRGTRPSSDPKVAAPCWRPEGRSGMTHEETKASSKPLAPLADREPEDPPPSELLLRRAETLGRGRHRRYRAFSRARECSLGTLTATI